MRAGGIHSAGFDDPARRDERRQRFRVAYERTGNVSQAMREAGITSRSTAYRWLRYRREDGPGDLRPRSRARRTKRIPEAIKDELVDLRHETPTWGRRRLADTLQLRHGRSLVSPAGVERVLDERGLWRGWNGDVAWGGTIRNPVGLTGWTATARLDTDRLLADCQRGVQLDGHCQAPAAVATLEELWARIGSDHARREALLRTPGLGSWLLRSLVHLGHALIVTGRWFPAWCALEEAKHWLETLPTERRQLAYEEDAPWGSAAVGTPWTALSFSSVRPDLYLASLRRDDVWLECCQYLGVVLRDDPKQRGIEALADALRAFTTWSHREPEPCWPDNRRGTLEHDFARLKLRNGRFPDADIAAHLHHATGQIRHAQTRGAPGHGMLAAIEITRAMYHHGAAARRQVGSAAWARELERMADALAAGVAHGEREFDPVIGVTTLVEATGMLLDAGMASEVDRARLHRATTTCLRNGYAGQARELLAIPGIDRHLPEPTRHRLRGLVAETRRPTRRTEA